MAQPQRGVDHDPNGAVGPKDFVSAFGTPPLVVEREVQAHLVKGLAEIHEGLVPLLRDQIASSGLPVDRIGVSVKHSPEDAWREIVFSVFVDVGTEQALALWDSIGADIAEWRVALPTRLRKVLDEQVAVFVEWP